MKRFLSSGGGGAPAKVARKAATLAPRGDPRTIICWNVENLKSRATQNRREVRDFLGACGADVVFLSEVKLATHCDKGAKKGDGAPRNRRRVNDKFLDDKVQCAALLDHNFQEAANLIDLIADIITLSVAGCMGAQIYHEVKTDPNARGPANQAIERGYGETSPLYPKVAVGTPVEAVAVPMQQPPGGGGGSASGGGDPLS